MKRSRCNWRKATDLTMPVPTYDGLFNPLLRAMRELGGSASVAEQEDKVAELLNLSEEEAAAWDRSDPASTIGRPH
jgi:hypothetical protein